MAGDKEIKESDDPVQAIRDSLGAAKSRLDQEDKDESSMMDDLMGEVSGSSSSSDDASDDSTSDDTSSTTSGETDDADTVFESKSSASPSALQDTNQQD